jgi:hypothetical protein
MQSSEKENLEDSLEEYLSRAKKLKEEAKKEIEKTKVALGESEEGMLREMGRKFAAVASQELLNQCLQSIFDSASGITTNVTPFERGCLEGMHHRATKNEVPF